jgi:hypothetical protein
MPEEELGEVLTARPEKKKKKERKLHNNNLAVAVNKQPPKPRGGPSRDHLKKML